MSSWQSFFNQLSKTSDRNVKDTGMNKICSCNRGMLIYSNHSYISKEGCSLSAVCCAINIDKHKISQSRDFIIGNDVSSKVVPLETFISS